MQLLAESSTVIRCPVSTAYLYASDLEHFGEWFPGVITIKSANNLGHAQPGKEYLETVSIPFRGRRNVKITVKEAERDKSLVTEGTLPPLLPRMEILFHAVADDSCQVTWRMFSRNKSVLARLTIIPLARNVMQKRAAIGMARLKARLEA